MRPYCRSASQPAGAAQRVASTARWRPRCRLEHHLVHAGGERARHVGPQDQQLGDALRAGSRCGRPCGRPRSRRPSAGSPTSDRSRTRRRACLWPLPRRLAAGLHRAQPCRHRTRSRPRGTSRRAARAVLSARSRKLPMRRKWNASSCSIVPTVTPRDRCERNLTHSNACAGSLLERVVRDHALELEPGLVLRLPDLGGQRAAHRARVLARRHQAAADRSSRSSSSLTM